MSAPATEAPDNRLPDNPILNNPYLEPARHYATDWQGNLDYDRVEPGRRPFVPEVPVVPGRHQGQGLGFSEAAAAYAPHLVNLLRREVGQWRAASYPDTTRVTEELLTHWFPDHDDSPRKKLFFAQREAIETAVWLNEVAARSDAGAHALGQLRTGQQSASPEPADQLPRIAFKMATGTGKTVVMAALVLYHYLNRRQYRQDARFADYFLLLAPGITIRDRLAVLRVDTAGPYHLARDYYHERRLVPPAYEDWLPGLNERLAIANYHQLEPRALQGNKRGAFDGKIGADGRRQEEVEDYAQVFRRLLGNFRPGGRLLVLNDEAHHCYAPPHPPAPSPSGEGEPQQRVHKQASGSSSPEGEGAGGWGPPPGEARENNARAAVWFSGLRELAKRYQLAAVYDLSATPYYLSGSGYRPYTLFPWLVTDFGLVEAIESGLVKIPYLPEQDDTQALDLPVLRNLYEHVKDRLSKMGKAPGRQAQGAAYQEKRPDLPPEVIVALDQLVAHYEALDRDIRARHEQRADLFAAPPVLIVVCSNTAVSREVYRHVAGYEGADAQGGRVVVPGCYGILSNYDPGTGAARRRPPTLLIDSAALENGGQVGEEFRRVFRDEVEQFRQEYRRLYPGRPADELTDADLLREVVNTVGQRGRLGAHVRCVVSVSMLTEGWDANTVTHILGLRAFDSQLLCEQVAGRALRRRSYALQAYDRHGQPTSSRAGDVTYQFPPEYARIIGIPFRGFQRGAGSGDGLPPGDEVTHIRALPERAALEIVFPNLTGYREDVPPGELRADYAAAGRFELDYSTIPTRPELASAFSGSPEAIELKSKDELRDNEVLYDLTAKVMRYHFTDLDGQPLLHYFGAVRQVVEGWYRECLTLVPQTDPAFKRLVVRWDGRQVAAHIRQAIAVGAPVRERRIRPVPRAYHPRGSTCFVQGQTTRPVFATTKSPVNYVVADAQSWELLCAKVLEDLPPVLSYVKNDFLDFRIPYLKDGREASYLPDFVARVRTPAGGIVNLLIEVTGMSQDKPAKKRYVEHYWLPAVNGYLAALGLPPNEPWDFVEVGEDARHFRNQLVAKLESL